MAENRVCSLLGNAVATTNSFNDATFCHCHVITAPFAVDAHALQRPATTGDVIWLRTFSDDEQFGFHPFLPERRTCFIKRFSCGDNMM